MRKYLQLPLTVIVFLLSMLLFNNATNAVSVLWTYCISDFDGKTIGTITKSKLKSSRRGETYEIEYTYKVNDVLYLSDIVSFEQNNRDTAYETHKEYPVGKSVEVFYDSSVPKHSTMTNNSPSLFIWFQAISIVLMSVVTSGLAYVFTNKT